MMNNLESLEKSLGYVFKDKNLLIQALTHISYANDNNVVSYERLEFLGDAVIELIVSDYIFNNFEIDVGSATKLRASLVSTDYLNNISKEIGLDKIVRKSKSLQQLSKKNIADLFESVVGAVYTDGGLENVHKLIYKFVIKNEENVRQVIKNSIDYKSRLQEYMQAESRVFEYKVLSITGPDHKREFEVCLDVDGVAVTTAKSSSIQSAEEKCAELYLNKTLYQK